MVSGSQALLEVRGGRPPADRLTARQLLVRKHEQVTRHRQHPEHKVRERHADQTLVIKIDVHVVANSSDVIEVDEDRHPNRYYFPRSDVKMAGFSRTETTSECPFKGTAHYYSITVDGTRLQDAAWTYEEPYDEHQALKERIAFYDDKFAAIEIISA